MDVILAAMTKTDKRKAFFSKEKKQKTFMSLSRYYPEMRAKDAKVFWLFFQERTACLPCAAGACSLRSSRS